MNTIPTLGELLNQIYQRPSTKIFPAHESKHKGGKRDKPSRSKAERKDKRKRKIAEASRKRNRRMC